MRTFLLTTAMLAMPGLALAQSQCAVTKAAEPFIQLPPPVNVTGAAVPLAPNQPQPRQEQVSASPPSKTPPVTPEKSPPTSQVAIPPELAAIPVLRHIGSAGATLTELGASHGMRSVAARHQGEFMVFQVAPDGQVAVAGLMTDLTVDQLRAISGDALTELGEQHGLRSFFLRSGGRFQVFYATPDGARVIPGVMWDATGQELPRKATAPPPGDPPPVTVGRDAADARVTPAIATSSAGAPAAGLTDATYGTSGDVGAPGLWILTTAANRVMQEVHDRMPVVLEPSDWPAWLGEIDGDPSVLLRQAEDGVLRLWPVSTSVNSVRNNGAELLRPVQESEAAVERAPPGGPNPA